MSGPAAAARLDVEADPKAVRSESVCVIRGLVKPLDTTVEPVSCDPPRGVLRSAFGTFHDLERGLVAMSHSSIESVEPAIVRNWPADARRQVQAIDAAEFLMPRCSAG